jgi:hypothetical protein
MAVVSNMMLAGLLAVMRGVDMMSLRYVSVVSGLVVVPRLVMFRRRSVVRSGMFVVFGGFAVMFRGLFRHGLPPGGMVPSPDFTGVTVG